jgi:glycosyltransferase involved in cell wall biosynthesis
LNPLPKLQPIIVISTVHGAGFGAEAVLENLLGAWNKRLPLVLLAPKDTRVGEAAVAASIPFVPLDTTRDAIRGNLAALWRLKGVIPKAAVAHAWHPRGFELAWLLARLNPCPATGTLHDHVHAYYFGRLRRWLLRASANRFSGVVAVSQTTATVAKQHDFTAPFRVIFNGIVDQPLAAEPHPRRIGFLGMNAVAKGFFIVRAWIEATKDLNWEWHLFGDMASELRESAQSLAERYPQKVFLRGRVDAAAIFNEIGILVHASTAFETFGMVLAEAGRAGIPAVAADVGGIGEVAVEGETAFLFDPSVPDKGLARLRQLMTDDRLRSVMGKAGRRRFETLFRAERMAEEYAAFWRQATASNPHAFHA